MEKRELEVLKRVFFRSFNFDWSIDRAMYLSMGDYTGKDTIIQQALFVQGIFELDAEEVEYIINNAHLNNKKAV
jgi:hypothetical protein